MKYKFESYYLDSPIVNGRVFDVFEPEEITKDTAVFLVHGGGWRGGSRTKFHEIMEEFNNRGYIVASTDYRLNAKDALEQVIDVRRAYDRFVTLLKEKGRPLKIAVYGESAGAHLAGFLICTTPQQMGEEISLVNEWVRPCKGVLQATPMDFLPWEGMMPQVWNMLQSAAGVQYKENPEFYEKLSLKNYIDETNPPIFFMEAQLEGMFFSEYTLDVVKKHRDCGIKSQWKVYHRMEHGFFYELKRKAQLEAMDDFCMFLEERLETI